MKTFDIMRTLSAHKTRSIIEKTIIESLFVKGEGTLSVITALKKLNAAQLSNNTYMLYGCKITISENDRDYTVSAMKKVFIIKKLMYSQDGSGQKYWQVLRTCNTLKQAENELESLYISPLNTFRICKESAL